jgi:hypothetical protein
MEMFTVWVLAFQGLKKNPRQLLTKTVLGAGIDQIRISVIAHRPFVLSINTTSTDIPLVI